LSNTAKTWFLTGASRGIGQRLVCQVLAPADRVAATSRTVASLTQAIGPASGQSLPLQVDLTDDQSLRATISQTIKTFGEVEVVVNDAGYAQQIAVEALSNAELRQNFEVNLCHRQAAAGNRERYDVHNVNVIVW
jgi:NAD(P)-dependent dehydrogenase (short-subunit alcohol dehydrogenase family)